MHFSENTVSVEVDRVAAVVFHSSDVLMELISLVKSKLYSIWVVSQDFKKARTTTWCATRHKCPGIYIQPRRCSKEKVYVNSQGKCATIKVFPE